jgi:hypothetical protein
MFCTRLSVHVLYFRGCYTSLCLLISLKLFAFIRDIQRCSHQYNWHHMEPCQSSLQRLQLKGTVHILPGTVHVWGLCAACAKSIPSPCSFTLWDVFSGQITLCIIMLTLSLSMRLWSYLWPLLAAPTTATLKVLCLTCIESVHTVVSLYYSRALLD